MGLYEDMIRIRRTKQGLPDPIEATLKRGQGRDLMGRPLPPAPEGPQSFQPQLSAAETAYRAAKAAGLHAMDYPGMAEGITGLVSGLGEAIPTIGRGVRDVAFGSRREGRRAAEEFGGLVEEGALAHLAGMQKFREATPGLDPWRAEVDESTRRAVEAGAPLGGILAASMVMGGLGPEDAATAMTKTLKAGGKLDEAIGAARTAVHGMPGSGRVAGGGVGSRIAQHREQEALRGIRDRTRMEFEQLADRVDSGMELPKTNRAVPRVRLMDRDTAFDTARKGKHLVQGPRGSYVGAPSEVGSPNQLAQMRERVDRYTKIGAEWIDANDPDMRAYDWYIRGRQANAAMFPGNPQGARDFAVELGIYSEGRAPRGNLQLAVREHSRRALGVPQRQEGLPHAGSAGQTQRFDKYMSGGFQTEALGQKTLPYAQQLDPTQNVPMHVSANDMIVGRVYGYSPQEGKALFDRGFTDSEHAFVDAEQLLAVDRANLIKLAGKEDWTVGELQAAQWVGRRAEDLLEQGKVQSLDEGLRASADDFSAYFSGERVILPQESTPGLPGVAEEYRELPFEQRQRHLSRAGRPAIAPGWRDDAGGDFMLTDLDLVQGGPVQTGLAGMWQGPGGLEMNPMEASMVLVDFVPGPYGRQLAPYWREGLEEFITLRAYMDAQAAGSAVAFIPMLKSTSKGAAGDAQDALSVSMGRALSQPEMQQVSQLADQFGWAVTSHKDGFIMFPVGDPKSPSGKELEASLGSIQRALNEAVGDQQGVSVTRGRVESVYEEIPGEGGGKATAKLERLMTRSEASDFRLSKIDSPELRKKARNQMRFMGRLIERGHQVRSDYLNALAIVSERGLRGLFDAAAKGSVSLPTALLVWRHPDFQEIMGSVLNSETGAETDADGVREEGEFTQDQPRVEEG